MKKKELTVLIEGLRKLSAVAAEIAMSLAGGETPVNKPAVPADSSEQTAEDTVQVKENNAETVDSSGTDAPAAETESSVPESVPETPAKIYTFEEVRGILAEKARAGFREEVKALLASRGAKQLSEISDPAVLASLVAESEAFGND